MATANCDCGIVLELGRACLQDRLGAFLADPRIGQMFQMFLRGGIEPVADDALSL